MPIVKIEWRSVLKEAGSVLEGLLGLWLPLVYKYGRGSISQCILSFLGEVQINIVVAAHVYGVFPCKRDGTVDFIHIT